MPNDIDRTDWSGDWDCPDCGRHNKNMNSACPDCATVNPDWNPDEERDS